MAGLINQLMEVLENQLFLYQELLGLALEKKQHIVKNDTGALTQLTASENMMVGKLQKLDRNRTGLIKDISIVLGKKADDLTLTRLSALLEGQEEQPHLTDLAVKIRTVLEELKQANDYNRILIDNSLEYIDFTVNVIRSSLMREPSFYTSSGEEIGSEKGFFDAKQ